MSNLASRLCAGAAVVAVSCLTATGVAAASALPFQIPPAPYGNPNGSFDAPPVRCVAVTGVLPGAVTITGGNPGGWGCLLSSDVHWLNLSTGATGTARLSDGLNGLPAATTFHTGAGRVVVVLPSVTPSPITPGIATFLVP